MRCNPFPVALPAAIGLHRVSVFRAGMTVAVNAGCGLGIGPVEMSHVRSRGGSRGGVNGEEGR